MNHRYLYAGRLAPIGRDFPGFIPGVGMRTLRIHQCGLPLANRAKVRVAHDSWNVGELSSVIADRGWFVASFTLDAELVDAQTEAEIRPGQPLSIGLNIIRSEMLSGVEHVTEGHLAEVSLCSEGRIPGAKIMWKHALPETGRMATAGRAQSAAADIDVQLYPRRIVRPAIGEVISVR